MSGGGKLETPNHTQVNVFVHAISVAAFTSHVFVLGFHRGKILGFLFTNLKTIIKPSSWSTVGVGTETEFPVPGTGFRSDIVPRVSVIHWQSVAHITL